MLAHIYALIDPRDGVVRYVGQTVAMRDRLAAHIAEAKKAPRFRCHRWVRQLLDAGVVPRMESLEEVRRTDADEAEIRWIARYRANGAELTNHTIGGRGFRENKPTREAVEKRAAALRGRPRSDAARAAIKAGLGTPEAIARMSAAAMGNPSRSGQVQSDAEKTKRAASNRGKKRDEQFRAAASVRMLGVRPSDETRKKMREAKQRLSPERRSEIARAANLASQEAKRCRSRNA